MNKLLPFLSIILVIACNNKKKVNSEFSRNFGMYTLLAGELDSRVYELNGQIEFELSKLDKTDTINTNVFKIDSLTKILTEEIDDIISELTTFELNSVMGDVKKTQSALMSFDRVNSLFFQGDSLSNLSKSFKIRNSDYQNDISQYYTDSIYKGHFLSSTSMHGFTDRYNNKNEFINYFFRDTPLIAVLVKLKTMKKNILEYERVLILKKNQLPTIPIINTDFGL